jgi:uncharacterized protein (TIGR00290 family)
VGTVKVFCSWSGGKESSLACYKAKQQGHEVAALLTMFNTNGYYTRSHRLSKELLIAQSLAIGIPMYQRKASWATYEGEFIKALISLKQKGIEGGAFGALYLTEDRDWVKRVCAEAGIVPLLPLWGIQGKDLLHTFTDTGFEAIVVAIRSEIADDHWLGARVDGELAEKMRKRGIDVCGENGEYHTVVVDGPLFSKRIEIGETSIARWGTMAFLRVLSFSLRKKT